MSVSQNLRAARRRLKECDDRIKMENKIKARKQRTIRKVPQTRDPQARIRELEKEIDKINEKIKAWQDLRPSLVEALKAAQVAEAKRNAAAAAEEKRKADRKKARQDAKKKK